MQRYKINFFFIGLISFWSVFLQAEDKIAPKVKVEDKTASQIQMGDKAPVKPATKIYSDSQAIKPLKEFTLINDATVTISYSIEIFTSKSISSEDLVLRLFLIEPNGDIKETSTPHISLNDGMNTGGFSDAFIITNPIKGNYVIGYLAHFRKETEASTTFSGKVKAVLKRASKTETFISEQFTKQSLSGSEIVTLSSNIVLLDGLEGH